MVASSTCSAHAPCTILVVARLPVQPPGSGRSVRASVLREEASMLRLLLESDTKRFQFSQGALVSLVTHSLLIRASILATREGPAPPIEAPQEKVTFLVPMNHTNTPPPREESVKFLREGEKAGNGGVEDKIVDKTAIRQAPVLGKGTEEGRPEETALPEVPNAVFDTI